MNRSEKQLPSKANFSTFCNSIALILGQNSVKGLRVTKIVKEIKFKGVSGRVIIKERFQERITKYLRLTVVFM